MNYRNANISQVAEAFEDACERGISVALLLGAGVSVSAGIPTAKGFIEIIKEKYPEKSKSVTKETYPAYMDALSLSQRKDLIGKYIDEAKLNVAHLYLSSLVNKKYVKKILTTNFDSLVVKSLALCGIFPAVYDFAASQVFVPGQLAEKSVLHLHGQRDGFVLLNTDDEVKSHTKKLSKIFQEIARDTMWLVVGYSGENDPVFERLAEIDAYQNSLFWVGYNDDEPSDDVLNRILPLNKHGHWVKGYDADTFFQALAKELGLDWPTMIQNPFTYLKKSFDNFAEFPKIDGVDIDPTPEIRKRIEIAIRGFENGEGFAEIKEAGKENIQEEELVREIRNIYMNDDFEQIDKHYDIVMSSDDDEAIHYLAGSYVSWGSNILNLAIESSLSNSIQMLELSIEKFNKAVAIYPDLYPVYNNWGIALIELAKRKDGQEAKNLLIDAIEKLNKAKDLNPENDEIYVLWGSALLYLARFEKGNKKQKKYEESLDISLKAKKVKDGSGAYNIACAYSCLGNSKESFKWFEKALAIDKTLSRDHFINDSDFDIIKNSDKERFIQLLDKYRPE